MSHRQVKGWQRPFELKSALRSAFWCLSGSLTAQAYTVHRSQQFYPRVYKSNAAIYVHGYLSAVMPTRNQLVSLLSLAVLYLTLGLFSK